ncbi:transposase, partial [Paenactinomyces guangxiensis]|nr:transposase [Paenactinomyces guangxiensis]
MAEHLQEDGDGVGKVSDFYPSSITCSCCGHKKINLSLSERMFRCEQYGCERDRDL